MSSLYECVRQINYNYEYKLPLHWHYTTVLAKQRDEQSPLRNT